MTKSFPRPPGYSLEGLRFHRFGPFDPTTHWSRSRFLKACQTPEGAATIEVRLEEDQVAVETWGPGADYLLQRAEPMLGFLDDPESLRLEAEDRLLGLSRRVRDLRLVQVPWVDLYLLQVILQQRVPWQDAAGAYLKICRRAGLAAPGPDGRLLLPPPARVWGQMTAADYAWASVEHKRAQALREAARQSLKLQLQRLQPSELRLFMSKIRGCGGWTVEQVMGNAVGDADAVPLGDYALPSTVAYALAGEARADDARMLELLEPYRGQRFRVIRWLEAASIAAPRFGPRMARSQALGNG